MIFPLLERLSINLPFFYTYIDITMASIAITQAVDWEIQHSEAGLGRICLDAVWRPAGSSTGRL